MARVTNGAVSAAAMIYCPVQNVDLMTNSSLLTSVDCIFQLEGFLCIEIQAHCALGRGISAEEHGAKEPFFFAILPREAILPSTKRKLNSRAT